MLDQHDLDENDRDQNDRDAKHASPRPSRRLRLPTFGLSATQLIATGLAAITATILASFLGVAGTVVGAALFSVITAIGKEVYSQSLRRGQERVRDAVPVLAARSVHTSSQPIVSGPSDETKEIHVDPDTLSRVDTPPELPEPPVLRLPWKRIAVVALGAFLAVLAVVTGVELIAGRPLSDVVRGDSGRGTTFFGNKQASVTTVTPPAPTMTVTVTPKIKVTTPTITQTAPPETTTAPASGTTTVSPSDTPTSTRTSGGASTPSAPTASTSRGR